MLQLDLLAILMYVLCIGKTSVQEIAISVIEEELG